MKLMLIFYEICTSLYNECSPKFKIRLIERKNFTLYPLDGKINKKGVLLNCVTIPTILQPDLLTPVQPKHILTHNHAPPCTQQITTHRHPDHSSLSIQNRNPLCPLHPNYVPTHPIWAVIIAKA